MSKRRNAYVEILGSKCYQKMNISRVYKRIGLAFGLLTTSSVILVTCSGGGNSSSCSSSYRQVKRRY